MNCEFCIYCQFPRSSDDNGGACKCKIMKRKTIEVPVINGGVPVWCPLILKEERQCETAKR